jgi:hypothetical protein
VTRIFPHAVIAVTLVTFALGLPPIAAAHARLRSGWCSGLAVLGLCPPEWKLFAPNVHKTNTALIAHVALADGRERRWESPAFARLGFAGRFREGQLPKFYDNLRRDENSAAWRPFAEWVAREAAPGGAVWSVRLERRYTDIPAPSAEAYARDEPDAGARNHTFYERWFR